MLFELRQYRVKPGQQEAWVKCMEEEIIPFQTKMGMVIVGSFIGAEDDSTYVWIRRFDDEEHRQQCYQAVYESDYWKNEIAPKTGEMLDREGTSVTLLNPAPRSVIR